MRLPAKVLVRLLICLGIVSMAWSCKSSRRAPPPTPYGGYGPPIAPSPFLAPPAPAQPPMASPQPTTAPPPTPAPQTAPAPSTAKLVAKARPALSVSTLQDDAVLLVSIQGEDEYLSEQHPLGKETLDLSQLEIQLDITGAQSMTLSAKGFGAGSVELRHHTAMALHIHDSGVSSVQWMNQRKAESSAVAPWSEKPSAPPLSQEGKYEVTLSIKLPLASGEHVVKTATLNMERRVRGRSTTTIAGVEKIAEQAAIIHLNKIGRTQDKDKLQPTLLSVDLPKEKHNRLVRFWVPHGDAWKVLFVEVVVERNGKVVEVHDQERFTCVAEGTAIDGEHGSVAVQDLRQGDRVWSWDVERRERVLSEVVASSEARPATTILVDGKLRVTGAHPIFADGEWVRAADLMAGATLTSATGAPFSLSAVQHDLQTASVYDITVTWPHNYFANGILVHNKRLVMPPARLDPLVVLWERADGPFDLLKPNQP